MKVLIVEDNRDHQFIIKKKLEEFRGELEVDITETVDEARDLIEKSSYETVLLDYRLQGSSGMELVKWLQTSNIDIPVIMITNMEDVSLAVQAVKLGVYDYLCKNRESLDRLPLLIDKAIQEYKLKKKLRETEFRYRTLVEGINEAVFLINREDEILYVSSSVERLFGCTEEQCRVNFRSLFSERGWPLFKSNCNAVLKGRNVEPFVLAMKTVNGETLMAEINASQLRENGTVSGIIGTIQDVTKRVLLERELNARREETRKANRKLRKAIEELKRAQEQLIQSEKIAAIGQLVSGFAHELNNPLFSAMGNTELLLMDNQDSDEVKDKLERILDSIHRARLIVRELIQFSQGETISKELLNINDLIHRTIKRLEYELEQQNVNFEMKLKDNIPSVYCNPIGMQRVFLNIIKNASQAFEDGNRGGTIRITSTFEKRSNTVNVEIANNGPEISDDIISNIFDPFFTTREVGKGTGLGLSTAYGIVKEHDGELSVSTASEWTTFCISLPVQRKRQARLTPAQENENEVDHLVDGTTLLIVEGEAIISNLISDFLKKRGFIVYAASSGKQALKLLEKKPVDTIIVDDHMPDMRGKALYNDVKRKSPELVDKFLFMIENGASTDSSVHGDDFSMRTLKKPFSFDELLKAISDMG